MKESLSKIVSALISGDNKALDKLFYLYNKRIYYFSLGYYHHREEAEEVVQEVFLKLWVNRKSINQKKEFEAYIFAIAKNLILNNLKKKLYHKAYQDYHLKLGETKSNVTENQVIDNDFIKIYDSALQSLPDKRKQIFLLSRKEGLSYQEIAKRLDISIKTVETQIQLALKHFREILRSKMDIIIPAILMILASIES